MVLVEKASVLCYFCYSYRRTLPSPLMPVAFLFITAYVTSQTKGQQLLQPYQ